MSLNGRAADVLTFPMPVGRRFEWHSHTDHQLAWAPEGVLTIVIADGQRGFILPPTRALWIPAGTVHETSADGAAVMRSVYLRPQRCPVRWPAPAPVAVSELLGSLIDHLHDESLPAGPRGRAEAVLFDLLAPLATATIDVLLPRDARAREVADALLADPADGRTLQAWGRAVAASDRTLARAFVADTGLSFGRWRTLVRVQAALAPLAAGTPVATVADRVGYGTTSAFVAAFRAATGVTPGRYFAAAAPRRPVTAVAPATAAAR